MSLISGPLAGLLYILAGDQRIVEPDLTFCGVKMTTLRRILVNLMALVLVATACGESEKSGSESACAGAPDCTEDSGGDSGGDSGSVVDNDGDGIQSTLNSGFGARVSTQHAGSPPVPAASRT